MKVLRGLSGIVAGGTVVLAATVVGAAIMGVRREFPGPGGVAVAWHVTAALGVLAAQILADRRQGFAAFLGYLVVFGIAGYLLWAQWWN
ncbi:hypothetical protein D7D52_01140 [Nocardia yunnanensis]|uniref:Uncharacterized protein n=1 Tax=Nocardia yunnanensis TaxID=2382165 RepID=A0A386Z6I6_9NOCA|nr:hypothetical protein [Nocardia yunnanensis]AYF72717.1 hypothetical protein D7D52_01140 [Nocardia yunnanensis]